MNPISEAEMNLGFIFFNESYILMALNGNFGTGLVSGL